MEKTKTKAYNDLLRIVATVRNRLYNETQTARHAAAKAWLENGGCSRCRGRGWIVTWDTLDSLSGYGADYGSCPEKDCTYESRLASGLQPIMTKYDGLRGVKDPFVLPSHLSAMASELAAMELELALAKEEARVTRGKVVRVTRGRKVPHGVEGTVAWYGESQWGPRIGIKDDRGTMHWTAAANVEVI